MDITVQQVELLSDDDYIYLDVRGGVPPINSNVLAVILLIILNLHKKLLFLFRFISYFSTRFSMF